MRQALGDFDERSDAFELVGDQREEAYAPPDRRLPAIVLTMLVMVVFAGGLWFAYHLGARHAAVGGGDTAGVPLIRADRTPDKVRPAQPGGMTIPNQNVSIYNEKPGVAPVENLLPPPEKPLPRPEPPPPSPPAAPRQAIAAPPPAPFAAMAVPPPAIAVPPQPAPAPRAIVAPAASPVRGPGAVEVHLASVRTPEEARAVWDRLRRDNADLLGRLSAFAVRTDLGDKGIYYRVEAGPFADVAAAERLCGALKRRSFGCAVAR